MARGIRIVGDIGYVELTKGYVSLIDADMAEAVGQWSWYAEEKAGGHVYAARKSAKGAGGKRYLHREIAGAVPGDEVDHREGEGLDNRRANLRLCTHQQNMWNSVSNRDGLPKGVVAFGDGFVAVVGLDGASYQVGRSYDDPAKAHEVYKAFARAIHREFYREPT